MTIDQLARDKNSKHKLKDSQGKDIGTLNFENFTIISKPSFVEYLRSGWSINMSVAVDFTASNGETCEPNSLHRIYPNGQLNDYELAI